MAVTQREATNGFPSASSLKTVVYFFLKVLIFILQTD